MSQGYLHEVHNYCPYCNEAISILIDTSLQEQLYIEDCEVCCRPITVKLNWSDEDNYELYLLMENDISCG